MIFRVIILGVLGPTLALSATWYEAIMIAAISGKESVSIESVERLRVFPTDSVLGEIDGFALGVITFNDLEAQSIIAMADDVFHGRFSFYGTDYSVNVPFRKNDDLFGMSTWHLRLSGFIVPGLLIRAYEVSGDDKYLHAAVDYVIDWADFESSLLIPRGTIFNDHATAARAVVTTKIWRLYRVSRIFSVSEATHLLQYVEKLSRLLQDTRLYEYQSNHGLMQNLALLHIAVAFPILHESDRNIEVGTSRLMAQLRYYVNVEGVILEHSTGYHHQFLSGLSAAWRYLALLGRPVPAEMAGRYERAFKFDANMIRPDGTLPPIGDTRDIPYGIVQKSPLDDELIASSLVPVSVNEAWRPDHVYLAPAAGYAVIWNGLEYWPSIDDLSQTALVWANFPGDSHKHADELSVTIWSDGNQWVRGLGYWPYISSRPEAVGWRSSNAPHWLGESSLKERSSFLTGYTIDESLTFVDIIRRNAKGDSVRRQVAILDAGVWLVLDNFESESSGEVELIWKFSPDLTMEKRSPQSYSVISKLGPQALTVDFSLPAKSKIEPDYDGHAKWNDGLVSGYDIVEAPAIRLVSGASSPVLNTVFRLRDKASTNTVTRPDFTWKSPEQWKLVLDSGSDQQIAIQRNGDRLGFSGPGEAGLSLDISSTDLEQTRNARRQAVEAFEEASRRYGRPFRPSLERRIKLTIAIVVLAIAQLLVFFAVPTRWRFGGPAAGMLTLAGWVALSLFIGLHFVV